jgi:hypothetical protein
MQLAPLDSLICQCFVAGQLFFLGTSVSSTNKADSHDVTEKLLKVEFKTITILKRYCIQNICSESELRQKSPTACDVLWLPPLVSSGYPPLVSSCYPSLVSSNILYRPLPIHVVRIILLKYVENYDKHQ